MYVHVISTNCNATTMKKTSAWFEKEILVHQKTGHFFCIPYAKVIKKQSLTQEQFLPHGYIIGFGYGHKVKMAM